MRLVAEAREQDPKLSLNAAGVRIGARTRVNPDTLSSLTSRSRSLIRAASLVVVPGARRVSIRVCLTQPRSVSGTIPDPPQAPVTSQITGQRRG